MTQVAEQVDRRGLEVVENTKDVSVILTHFNRLPDHQREVLRLKFLSELSYREISDITGLSVSNVGYLIHTGLKALRAELNPEPSPKGGAS